MQATAGLIFPAALLTITMFAQLNTRLSMPKKKSHNKWSFQILPLTPGVLGKGYRVDSITQTIEDEVNDALPYFFRFHKISKLVIGLGPKQKERDYHEIGGVAQKHYPDFDVHKYATLSNEEKVVAMRRIVMEVFDWLIATFDDSQCFQTAKRGLNWRSSKPATK
jgi:hypothetical protein